ncbi:UDP-4-amino-4,6-dideoxy-N-acetyl-beta-L-altrosamine N-acetyltransferase [bacterium DOLJORAL78_65_58]|nr:MAG: UDP-4-amino-4,6-dideoxy-N-acetyl-beta-L-altrosamine N-acetyltransferase [bacterium DOLZORAL124_64_63]PIE75817.1 MAG: UDP-4-amino-4,6-dideoxy-N-acetyl-beta-L-altrosamine N-acetyltransferase [bacterium DOLJORAL78_65_58]
MIAFVPLHEGALEQVLAWRTDPEVTRWMLTDLEADMAAQRRWFAAIRDDETQAHWLIRVGGRDVGLAYLADIDHTARCCSCGFYIGEAAARRHGGMVLPGIINHVFAEMGFAKITGQVLGGNENVLKMHQVLGYRSVGIRQGHVTKGGRAHDLHLFEMSREEWQQRAALFRPYRIPVLDGSES